MTPLSLPMDARIQADGHTHQTFMWVSWDPMLVLSLVWQVGSLTIESSQPFTGGFYGQSAT